MMPSRLITGNPPTRQAIGEFSNCSFFTKGKKMAHRLTTTNEMARPVKPEIGPSNVVNAYSPRKISPTIAHITSAQCGEWYRSLTRPSHSGATPSMLQASAARLEYTSVVPVTKIAIASTQMLMMMVSTTLPPRMAVSRGTNGGNPCGIPVPAPERKLLDDERTKLL